MSTKTFVAIAGVLIAIEIVLTLQVRWTASRLRRIYQRHIGGRPLDAIPEAEQERIEVEVQAEYDRTIYRKLDLVFVCFHLPAIASWGKLTGRSITPASYLYCVNLTFWFVLAVCAIAFIK